MTLWGHLKTFSHYLWLCWLGIESIELFFNLISFLWGVMLCIPYWRVTSNVIVLEQKRLLPLTVWAILMLLFGTVGIIGVLRHTYYLRIVACVYTFWFWITYSYVILRADPHFPAVVLMPMGSLFMVCVFFRLTMYEHVGNDGSVPTDDERYISRVSSALQSGKGRPV